MTGFRMKNKKVLVGVYEHPEKMPTRDAVKIKLVKEVNLNPFTRLVDPGCT